MFQTIFPLPMPRDANNYIDLLLDRDDGWFHQNLRTLFGLTIQNFTTDDWPRLVATLNSNLPHNPRKLKSFMASWKTYIDVLAKPAPGELLEWRLTLILQYLAQFEEPLYRRVEQFPNFYADHLLAFCQRRPEEPHSLFRGLELPSEEQAEIFVSQQGLESGALDSAAQVTKIDPSKLNPEPRFFWISRLINELALDLKRISPDDIRRHLPQANYHR